MSFSGQVLHVFAKDVRRFWPALVGLGVLILYHRFYGVPALGRGMVRYTVAAQLFPMVLAGLAAAVVQDDPVNSMEPSLWQTSPLSGGAVMAAKGLFLGLFLCAIPVAVHVQWIVSLAGGGDVPGLIADSLLYQLGLLTIVALGAAVTPNLGSFLALAVAAWVGMEALEAVLLSTGDPWRDQRAVTTHQYVERVGWLAFGAPLLLHQYRTRHTVRTVALGVAALTLVVAVVHTTEPDWVTDPWAPAERFPWPDGGAQDLRMVSLDQGSRANYGGQLEAEVSSWIVPTRDPGALLVPALVENRLEGPYGEFRSTFDERDLRESPAGPRISPSPRIANIPAAGQLGRFSPAASGFRVLVARGGLEEMDRLSGTTHVESSVTFDAFHTVIVATVPLVPGMSVRTRNGQVRMGSVARSGRAVSLQVEIRAAARALDFSAGPYEVSTPRTLILRSSRYDEYLVSEGGGGSGPAAGPAQHLVGGPRLWESTRTLSFNAQIADAADERLPDDWFDDAELLVVSIEYAGSFTHTLARDIPDWPEEGRNVTVEGLSAVSSR